MRSISRSDMRARRVTDVEGDVYTARHRGGGGVNAHEGGLDAGRNNLCREGVNREHLQLPREPEEDVA